MFGGLVMGVLSALPLVGPFGNACCCLWVVSGGLVAAYCAWGLVPDRGNALRAKMTAM